MKTLFVCIGTTRLIGDSFGPLVGTYLKRIIKDKKDIEIIGDIEKEITYNNLEQMLDKEHKKEYYIIAIDSAVGSKENLGKFIIETKEMEIGKSVGINNKRVGNLSIKYVIAEYNKNIEENIKRINNVDFQDINNKAYVLAKSINECIKNW